METVACPSCGEENPSRFKLCGFCGTALAPVPDTVNCPACGEENPSKFRLCGFCGTALQAGAAPIAAGAPAAPAPAAAPPPAGAPLGEPIAIAPTPAPALPPTEVRKLVTLVFTDLKDSTALTASIDAEAMNEIKARYFAAMAADIERYGGKVEKNIGDAIMAVFGRVRAREDDALRGVQAAASMVATLHGLNEEFERYYGVRLTVRTGVNTGEVVANTDENATMNLATGDAVNVAARLEQNAPANEVLIGEITYALVKDNVEAERVELTLKGKAEPVPAYRLVAVKEPTAALPVQRDAPIVGREFELDLLGGAFAQVNEAKTARLVTVIGDAGVGKTTLIADFVGRASKQATVVRGRCLAYGDGITFWPLTEVTRAAAKIVEDDSTESATAKMAALLGDNPDRDAIVERVASAIGLSSASFPVSEIFWGARKFLESLAAERPLCVVIDDIHSAETTFLEFLEHLVDTVKGRSILILCSARPELLVDHADWTDQASMEKIELRPLGSDDVEALIDRLLGDVTLPRETLDRVVLAAEGNPLYVEQMVSMVKEHGGGEIAVPPTINALLAARLDNLTREERAVVEPASVIGLVFAEAAVEAMVPSPLMPTVPSHLSDLDRKQFVHPLPGGEDPAFRFHHILVRDAAYQSLLKRARATLHERFVAWAEPVNRERGRETEFEEILGYHLEQAVRYRAELGPLDAAGREIASRAATKLGSAGRRAFARGDLPAAANLLRRAAALVEPDTTPRIELDLDLADVLLDDGKFDEALELINTAAASAERIDDRRLALYASVARNTHALYGTEEVADSTAMLVDTMAAIEWFDTVGDVAGQCLAWRLVMAIHGTAGRYAETAAASLRVIATAQQLGDRRVAARGAIGYAQSSLHGPTPVSEAMRESERLGNDVAGDRRSEAVILGFRGLLFAMTGDFDHGRELSASGRAMLVELGPSVIAMTTSTEAARVELLAGDPTAAEAALARDLHDLESIGEHYFRSTVAGLHAHALIALGELDRALASAETARELADPDDLEAQILWRSAEGRIYAAAGDADTAVEHAEEAVRLARQTVDITMQAEALRDLGSTLIALGREQEAGPPLREALDLFERKGATAALRQTERILERAAVA
ncbi:MAG TPA: adenylate/guanylate cyclase domain-containing protein [Candidatus Limnocylindrales bacterium]|nr:adenylate/guanylate cyclase domain-containing protein [Candidatus Limnocylindrales bacterium]